MPGEYKKTKALCKCRWKCEYHVQNRESWKGRGKELNEKRKKFKSSSSSSSSSYSSLLLSSMREKRRNENKFKIEEKGKWKLAKTKKLNLFASWNQRFIITYKFHLNSFPLSISISGFCLLLLVVFAPYVLAQLLFCSVPLELWSVVELSRVESRDIENAISSRRFCLKQQMAGMEWKAAEKKNNNENVLFM